MVKRGTAKPRQRRRISTRRGRENERLESTLKQGDHELTRDEGDEDPSTENSEVSTQLVLGAVKVERARSELGEVDSRKTTQK